MALPEAEDGLLGAQDGPHLQTVLSPFLARVHLTIILEMKVKLRKRNTYEVAGSASEDVFVMVFMEMGGYFVEAVGLELAHRPRARELGRR